MSFPLLKTRWLWPCLVSLGLLASACAEEPTLESQSPESEGSTAENPAALSTAGRYIIRYKNSIGLRSERGLAALEKQGAQVKVELGPQNAVAAQLSSSLLASLRGNPDIESIEPDPVRVPLAQQMPFGIDMVQAPLVWPQGSATSRKVCIIDSGLYVAHEDIQDGSVSGYPSDWSTDGCGHGTHVAGTIAGLNNTLGVVGVNPNGISLYIVKIFGNDCSASFGSSIVDALNRCKANGANVVSMSLGGQFPSSTERDAFQAAFNEGVLSIAAAGNSGDTSYSYPASYPSVISVAAIDASRQVASFSQRNDQVDVAAPGAGVLSTWPAQENSSVSVSGVSYVANGLDGSRRTTGVTAPLVDGGLCDSAGSWSGQMVLCERGTTTFADKVSNVQRGGGAGAIIFNNVPGSFKGGLGQGTSTIPALSISQEDGQFLRANRLGTSATVVSQVTKPASGYELLDGTSMATPHVSGVAALVWSVNPAWTNTQIRQALESTAQDLGTAGRDNSYGHGLVQAKAALDLLMGSGNGAPTAAFSHSCTDLSCGFTDGSTDADGTLTGWSWSFGDGTTSSARNPSHTYAAAGLYSVSLTVTDDDGASHTVTSTVNAGNVAVIELEAEAYALGTFLHGVDLYWSGATGTNVDLYRNERKVTTTANDGYHGDWIWFPTGSSYTYKVCQTGSTTTCSPTVTVTASAMP
ncbi:S8 family serine peptidase [Hyalangium sp.]|uniref:S8 family serine peptidase n=1 Tax=Hyalangium sp. TaxID=2028555 RepID=UPI002D4982CA|nr:S8 family serine peptidase [Hyalangium sp.]HYI03033.1 S8 family serine peptidase [Hyalangium sp.]